MFEKKEKIYNMADIKSAHEKQACYAKGQGGIKFTEIEQEILDNHVKAPSNE